LINRSAVDPADIKLYVFSVNIDSSRNPIVVDLFRSAEAYPNISDLNNAELVYSLDIPQPEDLPPIWRVGHGQVVNDKLLLSHTCEEGFNCKKFWKESSGLN
jgi:hypothetical protein